MQANQHQDDNAVNTLRAIDLALQVRADGIVSAVRFVLIAIILRHQGKNPSSADLARELRISRSMVWFAFRHLDRLGLVTRTEVARKEREGTQPSILTFHLDALEALCAK
jgi:DNA-binding CsgD family transcriptional regulator